MIVLWLYWLNKIYDQLYEFLFNFFFNVTTTKNRISGLALYFYWTVLLRESFSVSVHIHILQEQNHDTSYFITHILHLLIYCWHSSMSTDTVLQNYL